jgi:hypothetical protein
MTTLRSTISQLANEFAAGVLEAIRGASLHEILAESGAGSAAGTSRRRAGRPAAADAGRGRAAAPAAGGARRRGRGGRLGRRSAGDIAGLVEKIVHLLEGSPEGLRAEQIREQLGLEAKELPRPIAEALSSRKIAKQGQKRATTYFVRGGGKSAGKTVAKAAAKAAGKPSKGRRKSGAKKLARGTKRSAKKRSSKANAASNGAAVAS